jgi:small conductance mechanosensitive channel
MDLSLDLAPAASLIAAAAADFLPRLAAALLILVVGYLVAGWLGGTARRVLIRTGRTEATLIPAMVATIRYAILILVVIAALAQLGFQTTSLLAALAAAGLAIGLALQGTLQNIAAGLMLLWLRPFRVGEFVESPTVAGTVEEVGLFATRMQTFDGLYKFVPNSELWNKVLTNHSRNLTRLIVLDLAVAYDSDIPRARRLLRQIAESHPKVALDPPVEVIPVAVGDQSVTLGLRAWTTNADYLATRWDLTEAAKRTLHEDVRGVPVPRIVRLVGEPAQPAPAGAA